jgi:hypothetical protein
LLKIDGFSRGDGFRLIDLRGTGGDGRGIGWRGAVSLADAVGLFQVGAFADANGIGLAYLRGADRK